ncbi:alkaline phosphatase [Cereibacter changlensis JA139]|uniref:Alkaline phosphatase n=2 Tax=Cereibacter changlensis TaxID=402884 RepID=A0A2T4JS95_9RHOB|nr:alkaline phosphatase [Cereibacter changlensis]PTE20769.1 alkaline phosphatase [Cereibacter changlensis JA139]PZX49518.1 alkaline phosphatase [Cereibacter changlensis]
MRTMLLSGVALTLLTLPVAAQQTGEPGFDWFAAGEASIAERLALQPITGKAKNVILFTADGNGVGTNYAIRLFAGQQKGGLGDDFVLPQETFPNMALVKTYSANGQTPDSAPTATAMNTGMKTKNDLINVDDTVAVGDCAGRTGHELKPFAEIVSEMGKSVGVISTARITHATPAAVYARTVNRDWEDNSALPEGCDQKDIAAQLVDQMKAGVIDIAMGGGRAHFLPESVTDDEGKTGKRTDGRNLVEELEEAGAQYAWDENGFQALTAAGNAPVLGLFEASHMKYEHDRTGEPSLAEMTEKAITALSANDQGFYLNVEAGRVDHANHDGNLFRVLTDGVAFADAIQKAMEMTNPEETLIIVTADHEHAIAFNGYCGRGTSITGLCMAVNEEGIKRLDEPELAADGKPYTVAGYLNGAGSVLVEQADKSFAGSRPDLTEEEATDPDYVQQALVPMSSETHSGEDVAVFARGPWAHLFSGVIEQNVIFHVMNHAVTAE